jgi:hypothetical protein
MYRYDGLFGVSLIMNSLNNGRYFYQIVLDGIVDSSDFARVSDFEMIITDFLKVQRSVLLNKSVDIFCSLVRMDVIVDEHFDRRVNESINRNIELCVRGLRDGLRDMCRLSVENVSKTIIDESPTESCVQ